MIQARECSERTKEVSNMEFFEQVCTLFIARRRRCHRRIRIQFWRFVQAIQEVAEEADSDRDEKLTVCYPDLCTFGALVYPHETYIRALTARARTWLGQYPYWQPFRRMMSQQSQPDEQVIEFTDRLCRKLGVV